MRILGLLERAAKFGHLVCATCFCEEAAGKSEALGLCPSPGLHKLLLEVSALRQLLKLLESEERKLCLSLQMGSSLEPGVEVSKLKPHVERREAWFGIEIATIFSGSALSLFHSLFDRLSPSSSLSGQLSRTLFRCWHFETEVMLNTCV